MYIYKWYHNVQLMSHQVHVDKGFRNIKNFNTSVSHMIQLIIHKTLYNNEIPKL